LFEVLYAAFETFEKEGKSHSGNYCIDFKVGEQTRKKVTGPLQWTEPLKLKSALKVEFLWIMASMEILFPVCTKCGCKVAAKGGYK